MDKAKIIENLFKRRRAGIKPGLERMSQAVEALGYPDKTYKTVHIAGTNGKGSTAHMMASVLQANGNKVGLFTSPHIIEFNERYLIDGKPVSDDVWLSVWLEIQPVADQLDLTFFEISALLALHLFAKENCDWVVLETGLGGRLDATNVVLPELSIITALSVEHTEYLGDTIEKIAFEKLGVVKSGRPCVFNSDNLKSVKDLASDVCRERASTLVYSDKTAVTYDTSTGRVVVDLGGGTFQLPLYGEFQASNAATVVTACAQLGITPSVVQDGLVKVKLPARFQVVDYKDHAIIFDVAHNPQAFEVLAKTVVDSFAHAPITVVLGMMADKEVEHALSKLLPVVENVVAVAPAIPRSLPAPELYDIVERKAVESYCAKSVAEGVEKACDLTQIVLVTGSFFTVSEAMQALQIKPY